MNDDFDFELVESKRGALDPQHPTLPPQHPTGGGEHLAHAIADNFGRILDVASTLAEVERIGAQADAYVRASQADCEKLAQETEAYVKKLQAETDAKVDRVEAIRRMMQDYNNAAQKNLSSEEFFRIISKIIDDGGLFNSER